MSNYFDAVGDIKASLGRIKKILKIYEKNKDKP